MINLIKVTPLLGVCFVLDKSIFSFAAFQILVNEGLISLLTDELTMYLSTMDFEHNNMEHTGVVNEIADSQMKKPKTGTQVEAASESKELVTKTVEPKSSLFMRRRSQFSCKNEDELKVVIERDNMIVGFIDAVDSDASDDSQSEDESAVSKRRGIKRSRSRSPKNVS